MKELRLMIKLIRYWIQSRTRYRIHSPYIYDFINNVLRDNKQYSDYDPLWRNRSEQAENDDHIETVDFGSGAGSRKYSTTILTVKDIVRRRSHSKKRLELLYRIARFSSASNILELGTSLGISTTYLKAGSPKSYFVTMEGCSNLAQFAQNSFKTLGFDDINIAIGDFDNTLDNVLKRFNKLDLVFFDGNHREEPTLRYYESCIKLSDESSIFVFDDIYWSSGMEKAWNIIKSDPRVSITIDLFYFGLVFFRKGIEKQNFVIRY